jgi:hypothetical protein
MSTGPRTPAAEPSGLLAEVLAAHGGLERWTAATAIAAQARFGGLLRSRFPGNQMASVRVTADLETQHVRFDDFPNIGQRAIFDCGEVRIETSTGEPIQARHDPRSAFRGLSGLRRNFRWDPLDATYFAGYAWWNYLSMPRLLARDGVTVHEGKPWREASELWRRLDVTFPPDLHTHSTRQTLYVDGSGLIRRHDYIAEPVGRWARAAHYSDGHQTFGGLVFPTHRRVRPRGPANRSLPRPTLVALDIEQIDVEGARR